MRRSRTVAAKRIWPTSALRRSAASSESRPRPDNPAMTMIATTGMAARAHHWWSSGQMPKAPMARKGDGTSQAASAAAHTMSAAPARVAAQRGSLQPHAR